MTMHLNRRSFLALSAAAVPTALLLPNAAAAAPAVCSVGGLAIGGCDPVGYFTDGAPVEGARQNALMWRGAMWLFQSEDTMERFTRTPHAFAPRYGGYCAMSMAEGRLVPGDPSVWEIDDGHLYLLKSEAQRGQWDANVTTNIAAADANWPALLKV